MVWKRVIVACLICVLAAMLALPAAASAAEFPFSLSSSSALFESAYPSEVIDIADRLVSKLDIGQDYVFFQMDEEIYCLVYGDISFDGTFVGTDCSCITFAYSDGSYLLYEKYLGECSLMPDLHMVYSNLGPYPDLSSNDSRYELTILIALGVLTLYFILLEVFRPSTRNPW